MLLTAFALTFFHSTLAEEMEEGCYDCHLKEEDARLRAPAEEISRGRHRNITCEACHEFDVPSKAAEDFKKIHVRILTASELTNERITETCAFRCHKATLPLRHGKSVRVEIGSVNVEGLVVTCTNCHETHETRDKNDSASWTNRVNIPATCAGREDFACHNSDEVSKKYELLNAYVTYKATGHGRMQELGYGKAAVCVDCHAPEERPHQSIVDKKNKESPIHPDNREKTCTQEGCHKGKGVEVGVGSMHGRPELILLGIPVERFIDWFYKTMITVFVGGAIVFISLDLTRRVGGKR